MGDPRRLGKTYESPRKVFDADRIANDGKLKGEYGLKNTREVWKANQTLKRARREARRLLSRGAQGQVEGKPLLEKLARLGITKPEAKLDDVLTLELRDLLGRRLQSIVLKRGLARSAKQSRQLIVQGYISVNGRKVSVPSYLVKAGEESTVGYYKPFNLEAASAPAKEEAPRGERKGHEQEAGEQKEAQAAQQAPEPAGG